MNVRWKAWLLKHLANVWGPYLLSGIRVTDVAPDFRSIDVRMALRPWNRNYVGTHFGGSLFAMSYLGASRVVPSVSAPPSELRNRLGSARSTLLVHWPHCRRQGSGSRRS